MCVCGGRDNTPGSWPDDAPKMSCFKSPGGSRTSVVKGVCQTYCRGWKLWTLSRADGEQWLFSQLLWPMKRLALEVTHGGEQGNGGTAIY